MSDDSGYDAYGGAGDSDDPSGITVDTDNNGLAELDAGDAAVDTNDDGILDTAVIEHGGSIYGFVDHDGDRRADAVVKLDAESGELVDGWRLQPDGDWDATKDEEVLFPAVVEQDQPEATTETEPDGGSEPASEPGPERDSGADPASDGPDADGGNDQPATDGEDATGEPGEQGPATTAVVAVPDIFLHEEPPVDHPTHLTWEAERFAQQTTADLWSMAHRGEPWPIDPDTGIPYAPMVVLGVLATDTEIDPQIRATATQVKESWTNQYNIIVKPTPG